MRQKNWWKIFYYWKYETSMKRWFKLNFRVWTQFLYYWKYGTRTERWLKLNFRVWTPIPLMGVYTSIHTYTDG